MPKKTHYSEPMHCLVGSLLWQEILGDQFFLKKTCLSEKHLDTFSGKNCACLPFPEESDRLLNPYYSFPTNFQGTGP